MATKTFNAVVSEFNDIDFRMQPHPVSGDLFRLRNIEAIKTSIRNLVLTGTFERPFHPEIGGNVMSLLFENYTPLVERLVEKMITETIENFEPRAKIEGVAVQFTDDNSAYITVAFTPINMSTPVEFDILLERTR